MRRSTTEPPTTPPSDYLVSLRPWKLTVKKYCQGRKQDWLIRNETSSREVQRTEGAKVLRSEERDTVQVDEGIGCSSLGNSHRNSDNYPGVRRRGGRHIGNDRLPGTVLVARERLLERLRGVSLSANRRSERPTVRSNRNLLTVGDDFRLVDANGDYSEMETSRESLVKDLLFTDSVFQTGQLSATQATRSKRKPPGLTGEALTRLHLEVFNSCDDGEVSLGAYQECSICLENFAEGDELVRLPCASWIPLCLLGSMGSDLWGLPVLSKRGSRKL